MTESHFDKIYKELLNELLTDESSVIDYNSRTKTNIKTIPGGKSFKLDLSDGYLPITTSRRFHIKTCAAEIAWFFSGEQDLTWFQKYSKIWDGFVEDGTNVVKSAYGYRWRNHFKRDQIELAIDTLKANPSDRRIFVCNWDASEDGLGEPSKNVPCPLGFTLSIVNGTLHMSMFLRSSDVFVGLPYDVVGHAMILGVIANSIGVNVGTLHVTLAHPHLYEAHWEMARETIANVYRPRTLPRNTIFGIEAISKCPEDFVEQMVTEMSYIDQTEYNPRPEIVL